MRREQTVRDEALSSCGEYNAYFQGNSVEYPAAWRVPGSLRANRSSPIANCASGARTAVAICEGKSLLLASR